MTTLLAAGIAAVIAIDGRAVRGAKGAHPVATLAHGIGVVLGQAAVDAKPDEIPAVRELLKAFASPARAYQPRHLQAQHQPHMPHRELREQQAARPRPPPTAPGPHRSPSPGRQASPA